MTPRGTLGLYCVHISQLLTHQAIYTTPFTLQLRYKPLGILQRVTKSQKVHISSHDGLQKLHNINYQNTGHRVSLRGSRVAGIFPISTKILWEQYIYCSSYSGSIILWLPSIHNINICWEPWYPMKEVMEEINQLQTCFHLAIWKQSLRNMISSFTFT